MSYFLDGVNIGPLSGPLSTSLIGVGVYIIVMVCMDRPYLTSTDLVEG